MTSKALNRICTTLFFLGWANFMVFCEIGLRIGGEAMHGKIENGHYYLATGYISRGAFRLDAPQGYIEVSANVFRYSRIHGYSVWVTFPLGLIACVVGVLSEKKRRRELPHVA